MRDVTYSPVVFFPRALGVATLRLRALMSQKTTRSREAIVQILRSRIWLATALTAVVVAASSGAIAGAALRHGPRPDAEENEEVVANASSLTGSCGVERWAVKTGTDAD